MRTAAATVMVAATIATAIAGCRGSRHPASAECRAAGGKIANAMKSVRPELEIAGIDPAPDVAALCVEDAWTGTIVRCYSDAITPRQARECSDLLSDVQRDHAREMQEALYKRASAVAPADADGLPACREYEALVKALDQCPQLPTAARDSLSEAFAVQREAWREALASGGAEVRETIEMGCRAAVEGLTGMRASLGC